MLAFACVFLAESCERPLGERAPVVICCQARNIFRMRRRAGFTLIEIVLAIAVLMLVVGVAVPSVRGVLADRRLRRSLDEFNTMVRQAQEHSMIERRSYLIIWRDKEFALRAEGLY